MQGHGTCPGQSLRDEAYRVLGVDLTTIPGISVLHVQTVLAEVGPDLSRFPTAAAFSSWMGLCPDNNVSGGKNLRAGKRRVKKPPSRGPPEAAPALHGGPST